MRTPKHNDDNVALLAEEVTDTMPQEVLVQAFFESQYDYYDSDKEAFLRDWADMEMGEKLASYAVEDEME
jgi:ribose 5-phosphate isomerase RpiB